MGNIKEKVLLRTLTRKSIVRDTGTRYDGQCVQELIDTMPSAIVYLYYFVAKVTFTEDILDEVKIFQRDRFLKPGRDKEMYFARKRRTAGALAAKGDFSALVKFKKREKNFYLSRYYDSLYSCLCLTSKSYLTWKNQGH